MPFFGVPFFEQKINFGVSLWLKSKVVINSGMSFIDFDQISLILGYTFSMACKFWGMVFAKIYKF